MADDPQSTLIASLDYVPLSDLLAICQISKPFGRLCKQAIKNRIRNELLRQPNLATYKCLCLTNMTTRAICQAIATDPWRPSQNAETYDLLTRRFSPLESFIIMNDPMNYATELYNTGRNDDLIYLISLENIELPWILFLDVWRNSLHDPSVLNALLDHYFIYYALPLGTASIVETLLGRNEHIIRNVQLEWDDDPIPPGFSMPISKPILSQEIENLISEYQRREIRTIRILPRDYVIQRMNDLARI